MTTSWSWVFLLLYIAPMVTLGVVGARRVGDANEFATARRGYGALPLALAFAASLASGSTFLGGPGLAYVAGMPAVWTLVLYPFGVLIGLMLCARMVMQAGNRFANRSIPEFLGARYNSEGLRLLFALLSFLAVFYLAGQLVGGIVMFEQMLGISADLALVIAAAVLCVYVVLGGAHSDILTDGVQGIVMLGIAMLVVVVFAFGLGTDVNGFELLEELERQDPNLVGALNRSHPLYHSWWSLASVLITSIPLGLLPHIGNKLWALRDESQRRRFVFFIVAFGLLLGLVGLSGLCLRAIDGTALLESGRSSNYALPALFTEIFPDWLAALLGVGVLAALMSTADGLVISTSQIVANDIYRLSIVPRLRNEPSEEEVDARVLRISRVAALATIVGCAGLAKLLMQMNISLLIGIGLGGTVAALAGPLVLGAIWRGATLAGAVVGMLAGVGVFVALHSGVIDPESFSGSLRVVATWLRGEATNPFSCASIGVITGWVSSGLVSLVTPKLPNDHLAKFFRSTTA